MADDWGDMFQAAPAQSSDWGDMFSRAPATAAPSPAPQPQQSPAAPAREPLPAAVRYPVGMLSEAASGAARTLGIPGSLQSMTMGPALNWLTRSTGLPEIPADFHYFPTVSEVGKMTNMLGMTNNPRLAPQTETEHLLQAGAAGMGGAVPLLPFGPAAPALASGMAGGLVGEGARAAGLPPLAQDIAGVAAGLGVQGVASMVGRNVASGLANKLDRLGTSKTLEQAGEITKDALEEWQNVTKNAVIGAARNEVDAAIPSTAAVDPTDMMARLNQYVAQGGAAAEAARRFFTNTVKSGGIRGDAAAKVNARQPLTWAEARELRTELGQALKDSDPAYQAAMRYMYGGISNDMAATANSLGAGDVFARFNQVSRDAHEFDALADKLLKRDSGSLATYLLGKNRGEIVGQLREQVPDAVDKLAAAHIRLDPSGKNFLSLSPDMQQHLLANPVDRLAFGSLHRETPNRNELVERSIRSLLLASESSRDFGPGIHAVMPYVGAAAPYALRAGANVLRNPLLGTAGGVGAAAAQQPADRLYFNETPQQ